MELDELKKLLNTTASTNASNEKSTTDLGNLLALKAKSPIDKIKKSLLFEIISSAVIIPFIAFFIFISSIWYIKIYFLFLLLVCIVFLIILFRLYKKIKGLSVAEFSLKQNLETIYIIVSEFVKRYFQFTILFFIICLCLGFCGGFYDGYTGKNEEYYSKFSNLFSSNKVLLIATLVYLIAVFVGGYYFTKWYLNRLYGKYLKEIKMLLKELEE